MQLKVVQCGRIFVGRMYTAEAKIKNYTFYKVKTRSSVQTWCGGTHLSRHELNYVSILWYPYSVPFLDSAIQTDASGTWSCGAVFGHRWFQCQWPPEWTNEAIMTKELVPIILGIAVLGPYLQQSPILLQSGNLSLVMAIDQGSCRDIVVMHLLRCM